MRKLVCLLFVLSIVSVQPQLLGGLTGLVGGLLGGVVPTLTSIVNGLTVVPLNTNNLPSTLTAGQYLPITTGNCGCNGGSSPLTLANGVLELTNGLLGSLLGVVKNVVVAVEAALTVVIATLKVAASGAYCLLGEGAHLAIGTINVVAASVTKGALLTIAGLGNTTRATVNVGALTLNNAGAQVALAGLVDVNLDLATLNGGVLAVGAGVNLNAALLPGNGVGVLSILGGVGVKVGDALSVGVGLNVNGNGTLNVGGLLSLAAAVRVNTALNILNGGILSIEGSGINILGLVKVNAGATLVVDARAGVSVAPVLGNILFAAGANLRIKVDSVNAILAAGVDLNVLAHLIADINALVGVNVSLFDCYGSVLNLNVSLNAFADFSTAPCQALVTNNAIKVHVSARV